MIRRLLTLLGLVSLSTMGVVLAQDYDDIYFDSSKSNKKTNTESKAQTQTYQNRPAYYAPNISYDRDVDEYNRRGNYYTSNAQDTLTYDSLQSDDDFKYTERIRRFHNPSVIIESSDNDLVDLYIYTRPEVNIIVGSSSYYTPFSGYYSSWNWYNPWRWHTAWYYDPFYYSWGDPYYWHAGWSFYDPFWDFGWGWGWTWGGFHGPRHHHYGWGGGVHPGGFGDRFHGRVNNGGGRRPVDINGRGVGPQINRGAQAGRSSGSRIGNIVRDQNSGGGTGTRVNSYRGSNVRFGSNGTNNNSNYRRPSSTGRTSNMTRENRNTNTESRSATFNSSRSSNSGSSFGGSRGGGYSGGGMSNGARGGGHRR